MNNNISLVNEVGPSPPYGEAPTADPILGAAEPVIAPPPRRTRIPVGPLSKYTGFKSSGVHPLLELAAAYPMSTVVSKELNTFVPDATMLFHVLDNCDSIMAQTERFTRTCQAWLPIVSQLYISFLWNFMILTVQNNSRKPAHAVSALSEIYSVTNPQDCLIPGPLVPFFQALGAFNGPYTSMGNINPILPSFNELWNAAFHANSNYARLVPIPALILDQLHHFATWNAPDGQTVQANFEWYRNVFQQGVGVHSRFNRIGPQLAGTLYAPTAQIENARTYWQSALRTDITRTNAANAAFIKHSQLFGIISQANVRQSNWFTHVSTVMQTYAQFFDGAVPLRCIPFVGNGNVAVPAIPRNSAALRDWLYPRNNAIEPFIVSRASARRAIPDSYAVVFQHSHRSLGKHAESYAILTQVNVRLTGVTPDAQNDWTAIDPEAIHTGSYWDMPHHRVSNPVSTKARYSRTISNWFAQPNGNRVE